MLYCKDSLLQLLLLLRLRGAFNGYLRNEGRGLFPRLFLQVLQKRRFFVGSHCVQVLIGSLSLGHFLLASAVDQLALLALLFLDFDFVEQVVLDVLGVVEFLANNCDVPLDGSFKLTAACLGKTVSGS